VGLMKSQCSFPKNNKERSRRSLTKY
jgi:hypothetical protein